MSIYFDQSAHSVKQAQECIGQSNQPLARMHTRDKNEIAVEIAGPEEPISTGFWPCAELFM